MKYDIKAVVIGVSAGGYQALHTILPLLHEDFMIPVIIVQHRMDSPDNFFIESLDKCSKLNVKEPDDKDFTLSLSLDEPVCYARPSIDVLFETASNVYREKLVGIILTGANSDGSNGIKKIKKLGGLTIVQEPDTAEAEIMPRSAIATNSIDFILSLEEIPLFLTGLLEEQDG